jgi:phosphatidate cytidylyltransferase
MKTRAITGLFFVIVMLASVLTGHYPFGAFYLLLGLFCQYEFYGLIQKSGLKPNYTIGLLNGAYQLSPCGAAHVVFPAGDIKYRVYTGVV